MLSVTFSKTKVGFSKTTFRFAATTSFLLLSVFYWSCQSIAVFLSFDIMTKNILTLKTLSRAKTCQGNVLFVSLCHQARWWRTGRVETSRHCGARWVLYALVCLELSWLFGLRSLTPPSPFALNISWKGWCWACACSSKLISPIFILIVTWMKGHVNQRLHPCARLPPAVSQASWLSFVRPFCDVFDNCRQRRLILAPPTDALSTTRVRFDAIPELFPGYLTPKSAVSTNFLNAAQTLDKQSANAAVCELECVCRGWADDTD
jgi:hypothetical protein